MTCDTLAGEVPATISPAIRRAVRFIESNCSEPLSVAQLAELCELSLYGFAMAFRREVGVPPHQYICRTRVRRAQMLLQAGLPLAEVAVEAGFFDQSHLSRHFKRHCGVTPGRFVTEGRV